MFETVHQRGWRALWITCQKNSSTWYECWRVLRHFPRNEIERHFALAGFFEQLTAAPHPREHDQDHEERDDQRCPTTIYNLDKVGADKG